MRKLSGDVKGKRGSWDACPNNSFRLYWWFYLCPNAPVNKKKKPRKKIAAVVVLVDSRLIGAKCENLFEISVFRVFALIFDRSVKKVTRSCLMLGMVTDVPEESEIYGDEIIVETGDFALGSVFYVFRASFHLFQMS